VINPRISTIYALPWFNFLNVFFSQLAIVATEFLVCVKFGWSTITKPLPRSIALWWLAGLSLLIAYTVVRFYIFKPTKLPNPEKENVRISPIYSPDENESDDSSVNGKKKK
jgi:phosphatidylserine synthase 2